jgi:hypothetical protein
MVKSVSEKSKTRVPKRKPVPPDMDGIVRVNFDINRADHVKLKIYAAKSGCSMADLLRAFVANLKMSGVK